MTQSIFEQVQQIASDILSVAPEKLAPEASPETIESWDSIQHLNVVLAIEEKFGIQLSPEEIEQMHSIGAIAVLVEKKVSVSR